MPRWVKNSSKSDWHGVTAELAPWTMHCSLSLLQVSALSFHEYEPEAFFTHTRVQVRCEFFACHAGAAGEESTCSSVALLPRAFVAGSLCEADKGVLIPSENNTAARMLRR